jgi:hypothetical protein
MSSAFLQNFIKMRQQLRDKAEPPKHATVGAAASLAPPTETRISFRTIVTDKPPAKEVAEYFREYIKRLEESSDSD